MLEYLLIFRHFFIRFYKGFESKCGWEVVEVVEDD